MDTYGSKISKEGPSRHHLHLRWGIVLLLNLPRSLTFVCVNITHSSLLFFDYVHNFIFRSLTVSLCISVLRSSLWIIGTTKAILHRHGWRVRCYCSRHWSKRMHSQWTSVRWWPQSKSSIDWINTCLISRLPYF